MGYPLIWELEHRSRLKFMHNLIANKTGVDYPYLEFVEIVYSQSHSKPRRRLHVLGPVNI